MVAWAIALALACGEDISNLNAAVERGEITDFLEDTYLLSEHPVFLNLTPKDRGWSTKAIDRAKRVMGDQAKVAGDRIEITMHDDVPLKVPLKEMGTRLSPTFVPEHSFTSVKV